MKSFVYIALVVFLGTVAVQGYGPKIYRKKHEGPQKSTDWSHNRPSHESRHGPPQRPHHHGPPKRPHNRPHDFEPPNQHGNWDNSPVWYRSDSRDSSGGSGSYDSSGDRGSYDSYGPDDSYGPNDSYGPVDYSRERDSLDHYRSSYEDYGDWYDHHHPKRPYKPLHDKKPPKTTPRPIPTTARPIPTTPRPIPTTHRIPLIPTLPPHPAHTRFTPNPIGTTAAWIPNPTTPQIVPRPTRTVGPIPRPPMTTASRPNWHPTPPTISDWETTTNSVPETTSFIPLPTTNPNPEVETTTAEEEEFPTISPEIQACIDLCPSTPEYNPVCGSDDVTYNNEGKLFCAATSCGVNVTLVRRSACPPPSFDYEDAGTETPPPRTTTTTPFQGRTTSLSVFQRCMRLCQITASFTPVCGTDLITYMNMDRLKCAQGCGEVVEVLCEKPCAACGFNPVTPKTTTLRSSTTPQIGRSTLEPDLQDCISGCPVTTEFNPVCGSNHVTYRNPNHLICAQLCGVGVAVSHLGLCGTTTTSSTTTVAPTPTLSSDVLSCIRRCPVTTEYDPVCGSDDLTYNNLGNLQCSKSCGVEVDLKHKSRCVDEFDLGPDGADSTPSQTTQDIKGNKDRVTRPSQSTATTTPLFTTPTTTTTTTAIPPTTPTTTLKSTPTTSAGPNSSTTLGFTIPNDVLNIIFGSNSTQAPTTKPKNPDEDEDIDLDSRFNTETNTDKDTGRGHSSKIIFPD